MRAYMKMKFEQVESYPIWKTHLACGDLSEEIKLETVVDNTNRSNKYNLSTNQPNISAIHQYLLSDEFKQEVIDTILQYKLIERLYPPKFLNNMASYTKIGHCFHKQGNDNHRIHLDHRTNLAQGLIYFDKQHNALHSTRVHPRPGVTIESNTESGNGILILNTENSWHEGGNLDTDDRYFVLYSLELNWKE